MTSGIGDYIHAHYVNYLKYGIKVGGADKTDKEKTIDYDESYGLNAFINKKTEMQNRIKNLPALFTKKSLTKYAKQVHRLLIAASGNTENYSEEIGNMIKDYAYKAIDLKFKDYVGQYSINKAGNINAAGSIERTGVEALMNRVMTQKKDKSTGDFKSLGMKYLNPILKRINNYRVSLNLTKTQLDELNKIEQAIKEYSEKTIEELQQSGLTVVSRGGRGRAVVIDNSESSKTFMGYIEQLNKINSQAKAASIASNIKGFHLEDIGALAGMLGINAGTKITAEQLNDIFKKLESDLTKDTKGSMDGINLTGSFTTPTIIDKNNFSKRYTTTSNGDEVTFLIDIKDGDSEQKIDMQFEWDEAEMLVSAKNLNLYSGENLSLVRGSSLLFMIQDEGAYFINHYLNVMSSHTEDSKADIKRPSAKIKEYGNNALKFILLYKAALGKSSDKLPNVLLINNNADSKKGSVKAFNMREILTRATLYEDAIIIDNFPFYFKQDKIKKYLDKREDNLTEAQMRISGLLQNVHAQKIHLALSNSFIKKQIMGI